jgi:glycosyltransferase involved in cell wall biosynthesis
LLYIGKLEANKGANLLLDILREARPEFPTLVAGEGSLRGQMEETAQRENLNIKFLGWQEHPEVLRLLAGAEALLFPSLWPEPLTRVLLEAIGLGTLVLALNTGGTPDIIQDGVNGLLAENLPEFAYKLQNILKPEQAELRQQLRAAALQTAHEKFSQEAVVNRTEELYLELIEQKQGTKV